ncbi:MAG: UDP-glucose--hexose-1-phosphate uridylyltransferase [Candidatus Omnitrophica bacterium]|nr:UDP-glucose--hexose-1-phosphate uridylyltransferase [Candidatus Omnitrophota bacterium]
MKGDRPHRRFNPLSGDWVLVSPQRTERPWLGKVESPPPENLPRFDPDCYLCPGNARAGGVKNPDYDTTFVFTNDFSALLPEDPSSSGLVDPLLHSEPARGTCRVICFSPRHDLTLARMEADEIRQVVEVWAEQTAELGRKYRWVQVFENKGELMGCSNPHPHCQVWAVDSLPTEPAKEDRAQREYFARHQGLLLLDYLERERKEGERVVLESEAWLALVPYWAVWPFETLLLPKRDVKQLPDLADSERADLAVALKRLLTAYDRLFGVSFPYSMGWHGAPFRTEKVLDYWQLHAHFYPPLLRSATVKKFMVGYELLAEPQRDITPEAAAERLRNLARGGESGTRRPARSNL